MRRHAALLPDTNRRARGYRLANAVSYLLNPLVLPPVGFGLVQAHMGAGAREIAWTVALSAVFFLLVPLLYVVWMVRGGRAESLEVRDRTRRLRPLLVGVVSYLFGVAALGATVRTALPLVVGIAALFPVNTLLVALITLRWKISVHLTGLAGFVSVLGFVALVAWPGLPAGGAVLTAASVSPLLLLLPLLMWARVRAGAHTPGEVLAGAAFGLLVPPAELYVLAYLALDLAR